MKKFTTGCVNFMSKYLPDAFIFAVILTIIVFIAAMPVKRILKARKQRSRMKDRGVFAACLEFAFFISFAFLHFKCNCILQIRR